MISRKPFADRNEIAVSLKVRRRVSIKKIGCKKQMSQSLLIELACVIQLLVVLCYIVNGWDNYYDKLMFNKNSMQYELFKKCLKIMV